MAKQLEQTKRAIAALKAAGFSRDEFRVRTPYLGDDRGWGDTVIVLLATKSKQIALVPAMVAQGLSVTRWFDYDEREMTPLVQIAGKGELSEHHCAQAQRKYEELMQRLAKYDDKEAK